MKCPKCQGAGWYRPVDDKDKILRVYFVQCNCDNGVLTMEKYQAEVRAWMVKAFGEVDTKNVSLRNHRFIEEALELVQAGGCTKSEVLDLVNYVFDRPVGEVPQEVGGVMVTLAGLCNAHFLIAETCGRTELARCYEQIDKISAKHNAKPKFMSLPTPKGDKK